VESDKTMASHQLGHFLANVIGSEVCGVGPPTEDSNVAWQAEAEVTSRWTGGGGVTQASYHSRATSDPKQSALRPQTEYHHCRLRVSVNLILPRRLSMMGRAESARQPPLVPRESRKPTLTCSGPTFHELGGGS